MKWFTKTSDKQKAQDQVIEPMTFLKETGIYTIDAASIDAFARLRVSNPYTVFDSKLLADKGTELWDEEVLNGATSVHSTTNAAVTMTVSSNGDAVVRQTKRRFNYMPGKSQLIFMTGILGEPVANVSSIIGYFNSDTGSPFNTNYDGIYFEADGTNVNVVINKNGTANAVSKGSWNIDNFDGNGPSKISLDFDQCQIFVIDFEWLGVGRVRVGVVVNGIVYYAHEFNHANASTSVYMSCPNHSLRHEIRSTGGSASAVQICASVQSEGGFEPGGISRSLNMGSASDDDVDIASENKTMLIGIRLKTSHLFVTSIVESVSLMTETSANFMWELQLNPTLSSSPTWSNLAGAMQSTRTPSGGGSNIEVSSDGIVIDSGYISNNTDAGAKTIDTALRLGAQIDGTRDELFLIVQQAGTTGEDYYGGISWRELL